MQIKKIIVQLLSFIERQIFKFFRKYYVYVK